MTVFADRGLRQLTRVEVIDHTKSIEDGGGRAYVRWDENISIDLQIQDDGRTLKIFITERKNDVGRELGVGIEMSWKE